MTRHILKMIDPETHPRIYWALLILNKWGLPILKSILFIIIVIVACTTLSDGMHLFNKETATDNELALFRMFGGAFLLVVALVYKKVIL